MPYPGQTLHYIPSLKALCDPSFISSTAAPSDLLRVPTSPDALPAGDGSVFGSLVGVLG